MNMKKIFFAGVAMKLLFVVAAMILGGSSLFAQKTGYVKTETIFKNIQAYKNAIAQVEKFAEEAQAQLDAEYEQIESLYNNYQRIRQTLTSAERTHYENEIISRERALKERQEKIFGNEGELMKKRIELIKPIQDRVFEVIKRSAENRQFDAIVDVSNNPTIVYYSPKVDITEEVLKQLGIIRTNF